MKIIKAACILFVMLFSLSMSAQVLDIVETDQDGHEYTNRKISDINSKLEIRVNVSELRTQPRISELAKFPKELYDNITVITDALKARNKVLKDAEEAIVLYRQGKYDEYVNKLKGAARGSAKLLKISRIYQAYLELELKNRTLPKDKQPSNPFYYIFEAAEGVLATLTKQLDDIAKENGIYIQMGAWLITQGEERPIHLVGFDNIPEIDPYVVPRWQFAPSAAEQEKFNEFSKFAAENKDKGLKVLKEAAEIKFKEFVNLLESELKREMDTLIAPFEEKTRDLKGEAARVKQALVTLKTNSNDYLGFISGIVAKYKNIESTYQGDLTNFIISAENDVKEIISRTGSLLNTYEAQVKMMDEELEKLPAVTKQTVKGVIGELKISKIRDLLKRQKDKWGTLIKDKLNELVGGTEFDTAALTFSEEVLKLDIADVPGQTEIQLKKTGPRENGDTFVVKMVVGSGQSKKPEAVTTRQVKLFMVLPHVRTLATLIFAKPTDNKGGDSPFQLSPGYSILLKGLLDGKARRKSVVYNRLWDFSFGVNLASLDFNNDKAQELGIGFVISGIKDYFQVGYGYNVMEKEPYWFFGLRIPIIPVLDLSAGK